MNQLTPEFAQWARNYAAYLRGDTENNPAHPSQLDELTAGYVRRLIGDGRRNAIALDENDQARADFARESVQKIRPILRPLGFSADCCFSLGYRSVREKGWTPERR